VCKYRVLSLDPDARIANGARYWPDERLLVVFSMLRQEYTSNERFALTRDRGPPSSIEKLGKATIEGSMSLLAGFSRFSYLLSFLWKRFEGDLETAHLNNYSRPHDASAKAN